MSGSLRSVLLVGIFVLVAAGGGATGVWLGERASEPATDTLALERPGAATARDVALRSAGGFSGFEPGALEGVVTRNGVTSEVDEGALVVQSAAAAMQVRLSAPTRLYRITTPDGPLSPGDTVVVRLDEDGAAAAVLVVPADLREGDSR